VHDGVVVSLPFLSGTSVFAKPRSSICVTGGGRGRTLTDFTSLGGGSRRRIPQPSGQVRMPERSVEKLQICTESERSRRSDEMSALSSL